MEDKIKTEEIRRYSLEFALATVNSFFSNKERITGQEILNFCSVRQVNLLIVFELMKAWAAEKNKLKSPYFDYNAKPVQDALTAFNNALSQHIAISKIDFVPLVETAAYKTLLLVVSPYDFYSSVLDNNGQEFLMTSDLKNEIKYLKVNSAPLEKLVEKFSENSSVDLISGKEAFAKLDAILEEVNFSPEEPDGYIAEFSKTVKVSMSRFFEPVVPMIAPPTKKVITPLPQPQKKSLAVTPGQTTLYEQLIPAEGKPTLAENFQRKKIAKLRDSLSINQKFMFTKMLFNGDFEIFSNAMERLDMLDSLESALHYLQNDYPEWDRDSEEYIEFLMMVEKRFSREEV